MNISLLSQIQRIVMNESVDVEDLNSVMNLNINLSAVIANLSSSVGQNYQFTVIGGLAIVINAIILITLLQSRHLFKKSAFIFGLTIGDFLYGVALFGFGIFRLNRVLRNMPDVFVHPSYCVQVLGLTAVIVAGSQVPGVMFAVMGLERLLAVHCFKWYYTKWDAKIAWIFVGCVFLFCIFSLGMAFVTVNVLPRTDTVSIVCGTQPVMGKIYITYNYMLSIVGGTLAAVATVSAMLSFTRHRMRIESNNAVAPGIRNHVRKQVNTSLVLLFIASLDFGMVVLPNVILLLNVYSVYKVPNLASISLQLSCARSIPNLFIYVFVNADFRRTFKRMCTCSDSKVAPNLSSVNQATSNF